MFYNFKGTLLAGDQPLRDLKVCLGDILFILLSIGTTSDRVSGYLFQGYGKEKKDPSRGVWSAKGGS